MKSWGGLVSSFWGPIYEIMACSFVIRTREKVGFAETLRL